MSVSIVMPCYNEEEVIEKVVRIYSNEIVSKIGDSELIVEDYVFYGKEAKVR